MAWSRQVAGCLCRLTRLTRPQIAAQAAAYTVLGVYLGGRLSTTTVGQVATAALAVALVVSFGFVINDYADCELDRLTKPARPLPAGEFTRPQALRIAGFIAALAVVVSLALPVALRAVVCANLVLAALYALVLKRTVLLGNLAMAVLNSSILPFGALAGGRLTAEVLAVAAMSLLYTLAQEVLYTVDDLDGDLLAGLTTTAIFLGRRRALLLCQCLMALALFASLMPLWLGAASLVYLVALAACTIGPVVLYILPLIRKGTPAAVTRACAAVKIVRLTSLVPLILL